MCESQIEQIDQEPQRARRILEEVSQTLTYKPGFSVVWQEQEDGRFKLILETPVIPDVTQYGKMTSLIHFHYVVMEDCQTHADVRRCFQKLILSWERHEALEWLHFDGVRYLDPHLEEL